MLIYGHRFIPSESFYSIDNTQQISQTPSNSTIHIEFDEENLDLISYANANQINTAIAAKNIREIVYASSLGASFIIVNKNLAKVAKDIANEYLFDAKILVLIEKEEEIEHFTLLGIDGVIFPNTFITKK